MTRIQLADLPQDQTLDPAALERVRGGLLPAVRLQLGTTEAQTSLGSSLQPVAQLQDFHFVK